MVEELETDGNIETSDSFGDDLSSTTLDSEIIPISTTDDILISIHQVEKQQLERLEVINDFIYIIILVIVVYFCYKFIWGLLSYERF